MIMLIIVATGLIIIGVQLCLRIFMFLDRENGLLFESRDMLILGLGSVMAAIVWGYTTADMKPEMCAVWLMIHILFLSCSVTDYQTYQVYDVFQYVGIGLTGYLVFSVTTYLWQGVSLVLFALLQKFVFMRLYGKADGMIFLTAAMAETSLGGDISVYLFHMIISYLLVSAVQGIKGNIRKNGRLAQPVAFFPYITFGFWIILLIKDYV